MPESAIDWAIKGQADIERIFAAALTIGGPDTVRQLQSASWQPEINQIIKRLWVYCQKIADRPRDDYVLLIGQALLKNGVDRDYFQWMRIYKEQTPECYTTAAEVITWALDQLTRIKRFLSAFKDFSEMMNTGQDD